MSIKKKNVFFVIYIELCIVFVISQITYDKNIIEKNTNSDIIISVYN